MGKKLTDDEINTIIEKYKSGMTMAQISRDFGGHPCSSTIKKVLMRTGLIIQDIYFKKYTYEDCMIIGGYYVKNDWDSIYKLYPDIEKYRVYEICSLFQLKMENYHWSQEDTDFLINNYGKMPYVDLVNHFEGRHIERAIKDKAFRLGLFENREWSDEEDQILINNYSYVDKETMLSLLPNRTEFAIADHAKKFGLKSYAYLNQKYTDEQRQYIIDNWLTMTDQEIGEVLGKPASGIRDQRAVFGLCRVNKEYANYINLSKLFRRQISDWKTKSMQACNYQCIFTGSKQFAIHHLHGFNKIVEEAFGFIEKEIELVGDDPLLYTKEQIERMIEIFKQVHVKYPLGVCVRNDIHDLFHKIYGSGGNTKEQWDIFSQNLLSGKYNDLITL